MKTEKKKKRVQKRPGVSQISEKIKDDILYRISNGELLTHICRDEDKYPSVPTVCRLIVDDEEFEKRYARARRSAAVVMSEELQQIADTPCPAEIVEEMTDKDGTKIKIIRRDAIDHRRLQIDTRKFILGKIYSKVYGDKLAVQQVDADGNDKDTTLPEKKMTPEEASAIYQKWMNEQNQ